ncbi:MAG: GLPGLI family protein [Bacteroidetes bacterium]|nr:GLPGLI family protein [Bacteroidota bacterium]
MNKLILIFIAVLSCLQLIAQTEAALPPIVFRGKLTYERKMNMHKQMDEMMKGQGSSSMADNLKKQTPKYKTDIFELFFNEKQSLYKPAPDGISESKMMMAGIPSDRNMVFNDYENKSATSEKKIFEKTYLVKDSLRNYEWKITEEFRKIAGFNCRRAETIIMDSVYVIAFYTDAILAQGGPEGFNGLPGMVLGVVMPRLNLSYFATKFDNFLVDEKVITPPIKGDKINYQSLDEKLKSSMKQWGDFLQRMLWYVNI